MVGCVLIKDGQLLAEGWHEAFGQAHAEVNALKQVSGQGLSDVTMYVTLEPCSHQGKTPPCSQTVVQSGIRRVVIAMQDPFPEVDGSGITQLKEAGIEVTVGVAKTEAATTRGSLYHEADSTSPLDHWQMGDDAGWKNCDTLWLKSVDLQ